jgi:hypothetical protein
MLAKTATAEEPPGCRNCPNVAAQRRDSPGWCSRSIHALMLGGRLEPPDCSCRAIGCMFPTACETQMAVLLDTMLALR